MEVRETFVNATENVQFGETGPGADGPAYIGGKTVGDIYRAAQREGYGRCISRVYRDTRDGTIAVGWVFQSRQRYEGSEETYIREVWVEVLEPYEAETVETRYRPLAIGGGP